MSALSSISATFFHRFSHWELPSGPALVTASLYYQWLSTWKSFQVIIDFSVLAYKDSSQNGIASKKYVFSHPTATNDHCDISVLKCWNWNAVGWRCAQIHSYFYIHEITQNRSAVMHDLISSPGAHVFLLSLQLVMSDDKLNTFLCLQETFFLKLLVTRNTNEIAHNELSAGCDRTYWLVFCQQWEKFILNFFEYNCIMEHFNN